MSNILGKRQLVYKEKFDPAKLIRDYENMT